MKTIPLVCEHPPTHSAFGDPKRQWPRTAGAAVAAVTFVLIGACAVTFPAGAVPIHTVQGNAIAQANGLFSIDFPPLVTESGNTNQATLGVGAGQGAVNATASSSGTAEAGLQHVSVFAGASANASDGGQSGSGSTMSGRTQSTFTINAPGLAGTQGAFDLSFYVNGDVGAASLPGAGATATASYRLVVGTIVPINELVRITDNILEAGTGLTLGTQTITTTFAFGQAINFDLTGTVVVQVGAGSSAGTSSSANATADFASTFAWNGILDVRDASGNSLSNYSALDEEGADWSRSFIAATPVAEPGTIVIFGLGLSAFGFVRCKRRVA